MKTGTLAGILNRTAACLPIVLIFGVCWLFSFSLYSQNTHPNSIFQVNERTLGNNASVNINLPVLSHEGQILSGHSVAANPLKGTLNTTVGNSYIYTPNYFQVGNDSFDWQALDTSTGITATYRCIIQINSLNSPPTDLNSTSPLTIAENQPIGTILGEFNATDPDLNKRFTQGLGTKIWEFQTGGAIWSKPALASNGLVFFGSKDNKFYALRSETGQKVWEFSGSHPFCKPVVGLDNKVYVGSEDGKVYAFDFLGNKLWEFLTGAKVVASPTLDQNGTLYVGSCDNKFYALRCTDGSKLWEFDTGAQIHTKAAISESGILYFGNNGSSSKLYALNSSNGLKVWDFPTGPTIWSSPAIGKNGNIYFGCHDSKVYCLRPTDGTQVWSYSAPSQITSPVTIGYKNTLFVATSSGKLLAINIENGSLKWQFNTSSSGIRNVPTIAADNSVYFGDMDGKLYSINGSTGLKNWDLQVGTNFSVSSPCISSSGKILLGSQDNKFYCVQGSAPLASDAEWPAYGFNNLRTGRWKPYLTYYLVSGVGDGNNSLFMLETNGTLKTATTFDYESNASTYSIRVQAKDEFNATVEGNFTVTLTDNRELRLIADYHEYASQSFNSTMSSLQQVTSHSGSSPFLNGGERFVAVGDLFFHNNASSSDGINWTPFITNHNHWLNGVGYGGGLYMITAAAGQLFTSADGINFTKRTTPDSDDLTSITYGNGVYLIRKYWQAGKMLASNDGISWTTRDTLSGGSADKNNNNISGGNGYLVFVVPEGVRVSQDGISWNFHPVSHPYSSVSMPSVSYHKDSFYTVSTDAPDANAKVRIKVGRSLNGSSWNFNDFLVDSNTSLGFKGVFKDQFLFYGSDSGTGFQQFVLLSELSSLASVHKVTSGFPQEAISKMAIGKNRILFNTSAGNYVSEWVESQNQNIGVVGNAGTGARIAEIEFSGIQDLSPYTFTLTSLDHNNAASYLSVNGQYELVLSKSIPLNTMNMLSVGILGTSSAGASVYGEFLLPVTYSNDAPTDLNAKAPLTVAENQAIGSEVGEFNATNPDANSTLTYYFVSGAGDTHNTLFTLETNGTLKTATTFDYETNASTYSIRVQAKNEFNATVEGSFMVTLLDLYELNYDKDTFQSTINNLPNLNVSEVFVSGNSSSLNLIGSISIPNTLEVKIHSKGDLIISGSLSMNSEQDLILEAGGDIYINGGIFSKEDSGRLFLKFGLNSTNENNPNDYFINSPVNLPGGQNLLIKQGKDGNLTTYTVLTELGVQNSLTGIDLQGVKGNLSANYALGADLNASTTISWNGGSGFEPIGTASTPFTGNFEGLGHTIENLYIQRTSIDKVALFGRTFGSKISNLGVVNANIRGKREVSALIASPSSSLISRCFSSGTINGADENVAGLLAGIYGSTVINSYSHANATGTMYDVGGLGGELGFATIQNCYSTGKPQGASRVGGLVGVTFSASQIQNSFWDKQTSSRTTWGIDYHGASSVAAIGLTTIEMKSQTRFLNAGWDFNNTWVMPENDYPILRWQIRNSPPANLNSTALLAFGENQPIGTLVGEFNASDPDVNATLTYRFVSGVGDGNNSLFTLETNGTLKTATTFDYESNASTYAIRVQVKDELNASVEGNFTVTLTDVYEPSQPDHFVDLNSSVNLEMIWVESGTFTMGSPLSESGRGGDEVEHNVTLTKGFYLGKYEVTQAQYEAVMTGNGNGLSATPSQWPGNPNRPVEQVSWGDIQVFLTRLNDQEADTLPYGWGYVLPTEAQWEYACRAGTTTTYSWGDTITTDKANFSSSGYSQTRDVGLYDANSWGFFDMHGNAFEWIADWQHTSYSPTPQIDPLGPSTGTSRVTRGGSFGNAGTSLRSAYRSNYSPVNRHSTLGFRVGFQQITTPPTNLNLTAPLTIAENQSVGSIVGTFTAYDPSSYSHSFDINETEQNPAAPDTYEDRNVDSTDDSYYSGLTTISRWTATKDVRYDRGTLTLKVNAGTAPERFYVKQGANNILFDTSWWQTAGSAYNQDDDEFVIHFAPGQQTVYRFSTLDSDLDGNNDNMSYHSGSGSSVTNFNGDPVSTKPAILNETIFSVVVESRSLFQFEGHYLKPLHFSLTSGDGDTDNNLFDLDTNGILKTATTFDYETNASTYSIRVQARDELNASMEGNFTVSLLDINEGPSDLNFTTPLAFAENQSVGSIVGEFNVTDPDVNSTLTYYMVAGAGDGNNSLFTLDSNGTLKTGTTFDYESNASTYSIRVQAKDEYNATVEGNFTVTLTDVYETPVQSRPIVYVRSTAGAGGDGQSWSTAYKHLRDALSNVLNGSDIWVAGGTHKPSASNSKTTYFTINSKDLRFFGGFAGNETSLSQRTLSSNETILSADYLGNDAEIYNSSAFSDNAYHVFVISDSNVTLSGLTIRGGNAKVANGEDSGGGINASNNSILIVESCKLESNYAVSYGGGISTTSNTILHMKNSILQNNYNGYNGGGGMSLWGGENEIFNSIFNNNDGSQVGAVLLHAGATSANFNNCLFVNNDGWSKRWAGAGALNLRTTSSVNNCTFYNNNFADSSAKGDLECTSTVTVTNSIFWHPTKNSNLVGGEGTLQLSHSIVKGGALGTSVSTQDPLFLNSSNLKGSDGLSFTNDDGFQLNHNSPAYNAGLPTSMLSDAVDLDQDGNVTEPTPFDLAGNSRVMGAVLDIGAYEFLTSNTTPTNLHPTAPLTVAENQPVGTAVGEFNATDPDVNATLTYYLVSGAGDGYNSLFTLETNGTLKTATTFDYETNASTYSIRVQAKDEYNATVEGNFTVTLIDVFDNQAPGAISIQFASLTENQPVGTVVGKLNAVDPEAGLVHYSLVNGLGAMGNKFFTVDPTGVLRTAVVFDFEQNASHSIRGRAMDEFNASREEVLNIQVSNQWEDPDGDGLENSYDPDDDNDGFSDIAEIAYGSDPLDPNSLPNRAPTQISLSSDRVEENMPIGTMVGQLRTIDFDDPNGSGVYQYSILTNATGAEFFSIDSNGTMLTKQKLDFESNSSHTIALRVTDNLGAHLDQNLTIQVVDTFIPIVETGDPVDVGFQEAMLSGKLLDKGSSMDLIQIGMLVSTDPNPNLNTKGIIRETGFLDANDRFEVMIMGLDKGQKYFYRTYAMNAEGVGYGVVKDFVMQEHASGPSWAKAQPGVAANWWTSPWFGSFYMNDGNAWIMHSELGWLYPMASGDKGVWLWMEQLGWLWTDEAFYPFLYQNSSAGWLYFYGASQDRLLFYHYRDERWFQKNKSNNF